MGDPDTSLAARLFRMLPLAGKGGAKRANWLPRLVNELSRQFGHRAERGTAQDDAARQRDKAVAALSDLDSVALGRMREVMGLKFEAFVRLYLRSAQQYVHTLRNSVDGALPLEAAILPAHSLKSSSAQIGAMRVAYLADEIELRASALVEQGAEAAVLADVVRQLAENFGRVETLLLREIDGSALQQRTAPRSA